MSYSVVKSLTGGLVVKYGCPECGVKLSSPLKDAGAIDTCPDCGFALKVPGQREREATKNKQAAKKAEIEAERKEKEDLKLRAKAEREIERRREVDVKLKEQQLLAEQRAAYDRQYEGFQVDNRRPATAFGESQLPDNVCPYCYEQIASEAKKCKHCGEFLDPVLRSQALAAVQSPAAQQWNPGIAAVLSLVIPGAGRCTKAKLEMG